MTEILIPKSGDFNAWKKSSNVCIAIDWDGTCKDTMVPKWTRGFNWALPEIWPALKPYQKELDDICWRVNMVEETAGVQRFVALKFMMRHWQAMGLPVPDLEKFFAAVDHVEQSGEQHGVATYKKYQARFGYDDSPLRWSDASDRFIAAAVKDAKVFDHCRATLEAIYQKADLVVVSASKTEAVRQDLVNDKMAYLFKALCAQDFLPKKGIIAGLLARYGRAVFMGDTQHDLEAGAESGVPVYFVKVGDEAASWKAAGPALQRFIAGDDCRDVLIYPKPHKK